jgi:ketosteroid isomerase-like protein
VNPKEKLRAENSQPPAAEGELVENTAVDEFFSKLNSKMIRPKPGHEAVTAAIEALQRLAVESDTEEAAESTGGGAASGRSCVACGSRNRPEHRFCSTCGVPLPDAPPGVQLGGTRGEKAGVSSSFGAPSGAASLPLGDHHYHHHYHHHSFSGGEGGDFASASPRAAAPNNPVREAARVRVALTGPAMSRAEAAARQATQHWALACNTKQLDDLVDLYIPDGLILRPNIPPIRGTASIREFFVSTLDSGFGDVELEPLRLEVIGDIAYEAGKCKSLAPSVGGKRKEERGKYLIVLARQPGGEWKIVSDCWSTDLSLSPVGESDAAKSVPVAEPSAKQRKVT